MLVSLQRGDDEARIGPAVQRCQVDVADPDGFLVFLAPGLCRALTLGDGRDHPLGLADDAALPAPALARPVSEVLEAPGWLAALAVLLGGLGKLSRDLGDQPVILGQAEQVVDVVLFAPCHQIVAREPRIRPQQNAYLGPAPADLRNDPRHLLDRARAGVDIGPAQLGAKKVPPAKNIERQVTIGFVVAVKEAPFLLTMQRIIGGIEVEGDLARRRPMRLEKQIDE
jgi:hypothetical protein